MENYENIKTNINTQENEILLLQQKINSIQIEIMNKNNELEEIQNKINKAQEVRIFFFHHISYFLHIRNKMRSIYITKKYSKFHQIYI